ncbi:hypothetical protein [Smaragdicoccus niigatensis]|uniref:hypothetical protein n=1 Tax=Smaragdicoccus niigatensis TaxID=359359 RepID=UPI00036FD56F|nr:hypothetical protein [Smaragdicoccus niigatensis]
MSVSRIDRAYYLLGLLLIASGLFHLGVFFIYGGPWFGPVSWRKPTTFGLSFGLTLISVTWVTSYLHIGRRVRATLLGVFAADSFVEVGGITLQAWRGRPSHLNSETPFDAAVSATLALGGFVLIAVLTAFAINAFRHPPRGPQAMSVAVRAGFGTLLIGLATGAGMIARGVVVSRGGDPQAVYDAIGFLKPVHGVSLHGVLVLPVFAWIIGRTRLSETSQLTLVRAAVGVYALAIVGALFLTIAAVV